MHARSLHYVQQETSPDTGKRDISCDFRFHNSGKFSLVHPTEMGTLETISGVLPVEKFNEFDDLIESKFFSRQTQKLVARKLAIDSRQASHAKASRVYVERIIDDSSKPDAMEFTICGDATKAKSFKAAYDAALARALRDVVAFIDAESKSPFATDKMSVGEASPPSTLIQKRRAGSFDDTPFNEFFCMQLARRCGIGAAKASLQWIDGIPHSVVEHYDRELSPDGTWRHIPQETFCKLLGAGDDNVCERNGGPGLAKCFALMNNIGLSSDEKIAFLDMLIFNFIIGNGDADGTKFSILFRNDGPSLAPFCNIMSTVVYGQALPMAMKFPNSGYLFADVSRADFADLSPMANFGKNFILSRVDRLVAAAPSSAHALAAELNRSSGTKSTLYAKITGIVANHSERISKHHKTCGGMHTFFKNLRRMLHL
ncbi:MAG: HipA domain-containing protein [Puniceicoccales bacterium]|nr:HipA domain-containing protein [Puniceicoccales bacterium]